MIRIVIVCAVGTAVLTTIATVADARHERMRLGANAPPNSMAMFTYCRRLSFHKYPRGQMTRRNRERIAGLCALNRGRLF